MENRICCQQSPDQGEQTNRCEAIDERMHFLHIVSQKISEKKPLATLLNEIMQSSKMVMQAEASSLLLYEHADKMLSFHVATGKKGRTVKKLRVPLGSGIAGWVAKHRKPLLIEDCYQDDRFNKEFDQKTNFRTKSMLCVPLIRKNQLIGVMQVINKVQGGVFNASDLQLFEMLASHCAIAIENARLIEEQIEKEALERELVRARDIQQALLPAHLPGYSDLDIAARLIAAHHVGGDYYQIINLGETSLFIVADVTGKGIPAALIVSTVNAVLRTTLEISNGNFDLADFVKTLNTVLIETTTFDKFASCWFGLYHHGSGKLTSINAGHNPPLVFRPQHDHPVLLESGGLFLGAMQVPFESETITLGTGDVLVFYTDGVTEAWNRKQICYGDDRFQSLIGVSKSGSAREILEAIESDVKAHVGKAKQSDDFTCVVVKIKPQS